MIPLDVITLSSLGKEKARGSVQFRFLFLVFLDFEDLLAAVVAAFWANTVGTDHRAAMWAGDEAIDFEFEVGTAETLRGLRGSSLRYCHFLSPFISQGKL